VSERSSQRGWNITFSQFTIERLRELDEQTGGQVGFRGVGYLFLTGTDSGEIALRRAWELQRSLGVDVQWLSAAEVIELAPFVNVDGLAAAAFSAGDGIIDPHGVVSALWQEARRLDAGFIFDAEVLDLAGDGDGATVRTTAGDMHADFVVNAAAPPLGIWLRRPVSTSRSHHADATSPAPNPSPAFPRQSPCASTPTPGC